MPQVPTTRPSLAVLEAVVAADGIDEDDLRTPLYEVIDLDALDDLFRSSTGTVTFEYQGCVLTVRHDGAVQISPAEER
jgi:hypothetical protein